MNPDDEEVEQNLTEKQLEKNTQGNSILQKPLYGWVCSVVRIRLMLCIFNSHS